MLFHNNDLSMLNTRFSSSNAQWLARLPQNNQTLGVSSCRLLPWPFQFIFPPRLSLTRLGVQNNLNGKPASLTKLGSCCVNMIVSLTTLLTQLDCGDFKYFYTKTKTGFLPNNLKMRLENKSFPKQGFDLINKKPLNFKF